ncbi:hypothetical protein DFH09DRAFT_1095603 [Mycena vulgaris]|nr:hypothetical protein DFH09DRAFT_1095603 [Mycena vulgaris]
MLNKVRFAILGMVMVQGVVGVPQLVLSTDRTDLRTQAALPGYPSTLGRPAYVDIPLPCNCISKTFTGILPQACCDFSTIDLASASCPRLALIHPHHDYAIQKAAARSHTSSPRHVRRRRNRNPPANCVRRVLFGTVMKFSLNLLTLGIIIVVYAVTVPKNVKVIDALRRGWKSAHRAMCMNHSHPWEAR